MYEPHAVRLTAEEGPQGAKSGGTADVEEFDEDGVSVRGGGEEHALGDAVLEGGEYMDRTANGGCGGRLKGGGRAGSGAYRGEKGVEDRKGKGVGWSSYFRCRGLCVKYTTHKRTSFGSQSTDKFTESCFPYTACAHDEDTVGRNPSGINIGPLGNRRTWRGQRRVGKVP